jgi:hypothetical protein
LGECKRPILTLFIARFLVRVDLMTGGPPAALIGKQLTANLPRHALSIATFLLTLAIGLQRLGFLMRYAPPTPKRHAKRRKNLHLPQSFSCHQWGSVSNLKVKNARSSSTSHRRQAWWG